MTIIVEIRDGGTRGADIGTTTSTQVLWSIPFLMRLHISELHQERCRPFRSDSNFSIEIRRMGATMFLFQRKLTER